LPWTAVAIATTAGVVGFASWYKSADRAPKADAPSVEITPAVLSVPVPAANEVVFKVEGLACEGCVADVTDELKSVPGVTDAKVVLAEGRAYVTLATTEPASVQAIIEKVDANPSHKATVEAKGPGVK
jgi:copper chaperone CopZ